MVWVPGGILRMGSNQTLPGEGLVKLAPPEYPEHAVTVDGFFLDPTEVTNRAFAEFLDQTGRQAWGRSIWPDTDGRPDPARLDWPVTRVTHEEAVEYAAWRGACLPDESQLEWAARGAEGRLRPAHCPDGSEPEAWSRLHAVVADARDRTMVGAKALHGLFANAGELTLFRYRPYPNPLRVVSGASARLGYVVRSGLFLAPGTSEVLRLGALKRATQLPESRNHLVGFRCARSERPRVDRPP
jgi:formylglycine-generating enzyme required for sulfatase activity